MKLMTAKGAVKARPIPNAIVSKEELNGTVSYRSECCETEGLTAAARAAEFLILCVESD